MNRGADSHEIRPLTGVRGFAAMLVVGFHFFGGWILLFPSWRLGSSIANRGSIGVDLFFVLSGFILSYVYTASEANLGWREYWRFLWFRFARIYPNHIASLGFLVILVCGSHYFGVHVAGSYPFSKLPLELTLTQAWPIPGGGPWSWNYPSWSVSAEWFAYIFVFPVLWRLLKLKLSGALFLTFAYLLLGLWLLILGPVTSWAQLTQVTFELLSGGMLFGAYARAVRVSRVMQRSATAIFAAVIALMYFIPAEAWYGRPAAISLLPFLLLGLTGEQSLISKALSTAPALWLGRVSYAIYMSHAIVQKLVKIVIPHERFVNASIAVRLLVVAGDLAIVLVFGAALYHFVEVPSRNFLRRVALTYISRPTSLDSNAKA